VATPVNARDRFNSPHRPCPICGGWDGGNPDCSGYYGSTPGVVFCGASNWAGALVRDNNGNYRHWIGAGTCKCGLAHRQDISSSSYQSQQPDNKSDGKPNMNSTSAPDTDKEEIPGWQGGPPPEDWTWEWNPKWKIEDTYRYKNAEGKDTFEVIRILTGMTKNGKPDKTFRQRHRNGNGRYKYTVPEELRGLYALPQLLSADPKEPVIIAEGERKVKALLKLGFAATCAPMGTGAWRDDYSRFLTGRVIFLWPDNDEAGNKYMLGVKESLGRAGVTAHILSELAATLPPKGDVVDWLKVPGNDAAMLQAELGKFKPAKMLWSLTDLEKFPKPQWLIEGVIKKNSIAVLVGPPKCGKSFYSLMLALMIAAAGGHVVYIGAEDPGGFYERGMAWCERNRVDPKVLEGNLFFWVKPVALHDDGERQAFIASVKEHFAPDLIVVDTLAMNSFGLNENESKDMNLYVRAALELRDATHACIYTVHHTNRAGEYRGSSVLPGASDTFMMAAQVGDPLHKGGTLKITCSLQRSAKPFDDKFYVAVAIMDTLVLMPADQQPAAQVGNLNETAKELLQVLAGPEGEGGLSVPQLIKLAGWKKEDESKRTGAYRMMRDLAMSGFCNVGRQGRNSFYSITQKGRDIIEQSDLSFGNDEDF
jgi:archaellum biogenesis ATPase FlaH